MPQSERPAVWSVCDVIDEQESSLNLIINRSSLFSTSEAPTEENVALHVAQKPGHCIATPAKVISFHNGRG